MIGCDMVFIIDVIRGAWLPLHCLFRTARQSVPGAGAEDPVKSVAQRQLDRAPQQGRRRKRCL